MRARLPGRAQGARTAHRRLGAVRAAIALLAALGASTLVGCAATARTVTSTDARTTAAPSPTQADPHAAEPFTAQEQLVARGARLVVADGCAACHLMAAARSGAPAFMTFAGHTVTLADGRRVLVDERFLRGGLLHPRAAEIAGYDPAPMIAALAPLQLAAHPAQVRALAAFIEEIGPEPG